MPEQKPISRVNDFVVRFANVNGSGMMFLRKSYR